MNNVEFGPYIFVHTGTTFHARKRRSPVEFLWRSVMVWEALTYVSTPLKPRRLVLCSDERGSSSHDRDQSASSRLRTFGNLEGESHERRYIPGILL